MAYVLSLGGRAAQSGATVTFPRITGDNVWKPVTDPIGAVVLAFTVPKVGGAVDMGYIELDITVKLRGVHATSLSRVDERTAVGYVHPGSIAALSENALAVQPSWVPKWEQTNCTLDADFAPLPDDHPVKKAVADAVAAYNDLTKWNAASMTEADRIIYALWHRLTDNGPSPANPKSDSTTMTLVSMLRRAAQIMPVRVVECVDDPHPDQIPVPGDLKLSMDTRWVQSRVGVHHWVDYDAGEKA